ncbi:MAG: hypothetical protein NTU73_09500 [Ignavibacteriae bacterium]|nr:hypothetical protein [Ignavibacteriota bacterium]
MKKFVYKLTAVGLLVTGVATPLFIVPNVTLPISSSAVDVAEEVQYPIIKDASIPYLYRSPTAVGVPPPIGKV